MAGSTRKPDVRLVSGQGTDGHADMVARARALIPELRERAAHAEKLKEIAKASGAPSQWPVDEP